jgi:hypothetical protein
MLDIRDRSSGREIPKANFRQRSRARDCSFHLPAGSCQSVANFTGLPDAKELSVNFRHCYFPPPSEDVDI